MKPSIPSPWMRGLFATLGLACTAAAPADEVTEWNVVMERTVAGSDPYVRLRTPTIMHVAMFEAVNAILGEYQPYLRTLHPRPGASPQAAAIAAAHTVLVSLHPDRAADLDAQRERSLATVLDGDAKERGIALGESAAAAMLARRAEDGSEANVPYVPFPVPGRWRPTPPDFTPAFRPQLGAIDTFAIGDVTLHRLGPPPALRSARYARDHAELRAIGHSGSTRRSQHCTDIARLYAELDIDEVWNPAARQAIEAQGRTLSQNARTFALLWMAIFDATVAVFDSKYFYDYWRPVTAIHQADQDGNPRTQVDSDWMPLIFTPPFPSYPSGHGGTSAAARRVLEHELGKRGLAIELSAPELPGVVVHYASWKKLTEDIDESRICGGVHYRFDQDAAGRQGRRVGTAVLGLLRPAGEARVQDEAVPANGH